MIQEYLNAQAEKFVSSSLFAEPWSVHNVPVTVGNVHFVVSESAGSQTEPDNPPEAPAEFVAYAPAATADGSAPSCTYAYAQPVKGCLRAVSRSEYDIDEDNAFPTGPAGFALTGGQGAAPTDATRPATDIFTITPASVTYTDQVRVQVATPQTASVAAANKWFIFCGSSTSSTQSGTIAAVTITGTVWMMFEFTPSSLKSVTGCTQATLAVETSASKPTGALTKYNRYAYRVLAGTH
ncbi:hypothetical protein [Curtobacterium sp. MCBD17_040]|uniref:hypothetical protein n=1 Tax=Curtobacterium sp. MCBD17_040 TaxID=2175674 RepID=UPI000DA7C76F|nr:hypothetical protein [Curtobacterium sp. MCBD17_040]WIB65632.1 hypothetical protein DEI94_16055 [Curtobacterium sp. MCBD17_040]